MIPKACKRLAEEDFPIALSGRAGYNYASSLTVRHELDAFARRKTRIR